MVNLEVGEGIYTISTNNTLEESFMSGLKFDSIIARIKLKINTIIKSKLTYTQKLLGDRTDEK